MNKQKMVIWGRDFELNVGFDVFKGEEVTEKQKEALDLFLKDSNLIEAVKSKVEQYCLDNCNGNPIDNPIVNIFKYVIPNGLYVSRTKDDSRLVSLMCNFKFDKEHGMAIVFKNEQFLEIGEQGIVL